MKHVLTYRGKPITDCSREELIAACEWLAKRLEDEQRFHRINLEIVQETLAIANRALGV